ncbi:MAG: hypothetical protein WBK91_03885 [Alphaproteobacteria bacterium]
MTHPVRKERPILFTAPMVRAILEDRKTQTRRAMKPQPSSVDEHGTWYGNNPQSLQNRTCPHGKPGDRLWVREAWRADSQIDNIKPSNMRKGEPILYEADTTVVTTGCVMLDPGKLRPGIFMMRWMSRITLEITGVRVERLCGISEDTAIAEGMRDRDEETDTWKSAAEDFSELWESINGHGSWDANPWVWVIEFKRVEVTDD